MKKFNISDELSYGWETTKAHLPFFVVIILITLAVNFAPNILAQNMRQDVPMLSGLLSLVLWVLSMLVSLGAIKISLKIIDKKKAEVADLFNDYPKLLNFVVASILYALIVGIGFILLIVPGVIFGIKYHFYSYLIVDKNMGPLEALKKSGDITKGSKWQLFLLGLACGLVNLVGLLALGIGLFITIPVTMLAYAHVYRKLLGSK
ncbi:MAG: hypothetical protein RLZZ455_784 [Candidatus Parcubacteria bacterium]|jgi:uncharacterized membrane protein